VLRRLRWMVVGAGFGAGASVWAQFRLKRWFRAYTPPEVAVRVAQRTAQRAQQTGTELRSALAEGRQAMRQREAELRAEVERRRRRP
jgi:hypothetical protein